MTGPSSDRPAASRPAGRLSLGARLLAAACAFIVVALLVAGIAIGFALHRFVQRQVDERLDTQIVFLASMLHRQGEDGIGLAGEANGPPFDRRLRGWYWQVAGPQNTLASRSLAGQLLDPPVLASPVLAPPRPAPPGPPPGGRPPPRRADGVGPDGQSLYIRVQTASVDGVPVTILASAPRTAITDPLIDAMTALALCLAALGLVLALAMMLQVRLGLRPLARLRTAIADVRAGRSDRVPEPQPAELQPLVAELNALLEQNAAMLERARRHVANLAHGLKTPLATLSVALSRERTSGPLAELLDTMERRIRHHLGRARSAALAGPPRAQTAVSDRLQGLIDVLSRVHADRKIAATMEISPGLTVACEQQDFDEIAGNLLENAFKWARHLIVVQGAARDRSVVLTIDDDGPGVAASEIDKVLKPGQRLDESAPGFGFGLSITRELVELYGGTLDFGRSPAGGLRVALTLPHA